MPMIDYSYVLIPIVFSPMLIKNVVAFVKTYPFVILSPISMGYASLSNTIKNLLAKVINLITNVPYLCALTISATWGCRLQESNSGVVV